MNLFDKYFKELVSGAPQAPWHGQMSALTAARVMLAYPEHRNRTLRYLAKLLWRMGHQGEAYRAALALPPEELEDCAGIIKTLEDSPPQKLNTTIEIITKCNLRCPLCVNRYYGAPNQIMPFKTFQKIWNRVAERASLAIIEGMGETFLHPQIYDILNYIRPTPVHIDTNGSINMDHDRIMQSSMGTLVFSVDGVDQRTYEQYRVGGHFNKAVENMKAAVAAKKKYGRGPAIVFKYIIFRHNEAYVQEAAQLAQELGVDRFQTNPCNFAADVVDRETVRRFIPVGKNAISRLDYFDFGQNVFVTNSEMDTPYCPTPIHYPYIQVDGTLLPCCLAKLPGFFKEPITEEDQKQAAWWREEMSLLNHRLDDIWRAPAMREFRLNALKNRFALPACQSCQWPANTLGRLFDGTELETPRRPAPSEDVMKVEGLQIEADYAAELKENGLTKDIEYYRESGVLSPEAEALLTGFGLLERARPELVAAIN